MSKDIKRIVSTSFWEDPKVITQFTPEDKYFMLYLLTNPHTKQLGIYQLVPKITAFEMGYSIESIVSLLERFETKYEIIKYNKETMEVAIKNYLKHSVIKGGKPVLDCLKQDAKMVKDKSLLIYISESLKDEDINNTVKEFLIDITDNTDNTNNTITLFNSNLITENTYKDINDNDNDNDSIVPVSYDDTSTIRIPIRGHDLEMAKKAGFDDDGELLNAYVDFFRMRKSIKRPLTDRAISMLKTKLEELAPGDNAKKIAILNQSSFHCWQSVYELKDDSSQQCQNNKVQGGDDYWQY